MREWGAVRLKHVASVRVSNVDKNSADDQLPVKLCNYTDVYYHENIDSTIPFMAATASPEQIREFQLQRGDVLITKDSETPDDIAVPAHVVDPVDGVVCGYHLAVLRPRGGHIEGRYLFWSLKSKALREQLAAGATGVTRFGLRTDVIGDACLLLPEPSGQRAIANFLDAETAGIDALIVKKRRLIDVLAEREGVVLERELQRSSRGAVPFRRLLSEPPQYGAVEPGDEGEPDWPRYIRITDLRPNGTLRDDDIKRLHPSVAHPFLLHEGDLLFARSGATSGKAFRYQASMGEAAFAGYLIRIRVDRTRALPEFIELWTQTTHYWRQISEATVQATIQNVNAERYSELLVPDVPLTTQAQLVRVLGQMRRGHRMSVGLLDRQISLLHERRQALITAAVTGQLDIPGLAA